MPVNLNMSVLISSPHCHELLCNNAMKKMNVLSVYFHDNKVSIYL